MIWMMGMKRAMTTFDRTYEGLKHPCGFGVIVDLQVLLTVPMRV